MNIDLSLHFSGAFLRDRNTTFGVFDKNHGSMKGKPIVDIHGNNLSGKYHDIMKGNGTVNYVLHEHYLNEDIVSVAAGLVTAQYFISRNILSSYTNSIVLVGVVEDNFYQDNTLKYTKNCNRQDFDIFLQKEFPEIFHKKAWTEYELLENIHYPYGGESTYESVIKWMEKNKELISFWLL